MSSYQTLTAVTPHLLACRILDKIFRRRVKHVAMPTTPADTLTLLLALPRDVVLEVRLYMIFLNNVN
jgi:hypothetical protein